MLNISVIGVVISSMDTIEQNITFKANKRLHQNQWQPSFFSDYFITTKTSVPSSKKRVYFLCTLNVNVRNNRDEK